MAIGCAIGWFVLNLITCGIAPNALDDPNFESKVSTGSALQGLGGLLLIIAIIAIVVTIYQNIMEKIIQGPNIEDSPGTIFATHGSNVATGFGHIEQNTIINSSISQHLREVRDFIDTSALADLQKNYAKLLVDNIENESTKQKPDSASLKPKINDLLSIVSGAGGATAKVIDAIEKMRGLFGIVG